MDYQKFCFRIQKCTRVGLQDEDKIPTEYFLSFSQSTDLNIILVSPKSNEIIVHPIVNKLIKTVYFRNMSGLIGFLIWFMMDVLTISFLCVAERIEIMKLKEDEEDNLAQLVCVIISVIWIGICALYKLGKFIAFMKMSYKNDRNDVSGQLINCNKKCTNERLKQDNSEFIRFHKQLRAKKMGRLRKEAFWTVTGTLGRLCVITICLTGVQKDFTKHYTLFAATLVIFLEIVFHDGNDLCFVPNSIMITLLSMKEALATFAASLVTILMLAMPYFLITLKFTFKEKHYFTNIEQFERPEGNNTSTISAIGWSLLYLFKVMLTDDYQVDYFNDKHPEFFVIYHICIVFVLSLVIMNLIIAQTSQTYEEFVDNSKAEILKHRIFTIILFGMFSRLEETNNAKNRASIMSSSEGKV